MNNWIAPIVVAFAGLLGGLAKTLMSGAGDIKLISVAKDTDGGTLVRGGFLVNCVIGAVAALVSWMLYGSSAATSVFDGIGGGLTWANCGAAILVGLAGSGWLSAELDKSVLRKTAVAAANSDKNSDLAGTIAAAAPDQALQAAIRAGKDQDGVSSKTAPSKTDPTRTSPDKTDPSEGP